MTSPHPHLELELFDKLVAGDIPWKTFLLRSRVGLVQSATFLGLLLLGRICVLVIRTWGGGGGAAVTNNNVGGTAERNNSRLAKNQLQSQTHQTARCRRLFFYVRYFVRLHVQIPAWHFVCHRVLLRLTHSDLAPSLQFP